MATPRAFIATAVLLAACGGGVTIEDEGSGTTTGTGGTSTTTSTGTTSTTGVGGGTTTTTGSGGAGGSLCEGLPEAACLAAFPSCAPAYDDACCPICDPGPCADCVDYAFHHCGDVATVCGPGDNCWVTSTWGCGGAPPQCPDIGGPGGEFACKSTPGCVVASCSPDVNCNELVCRPVVAGSCTALCNAIPPSCPPGTVAEADGSCWTGYCIPADVCPVTG